jgi:hypothetical protein
MIRISIAGHIRATILTHKIFDMTGEFFGHGETLSKKFSRFVLPLKGGGDPVKRSGTGSEGVIYIGTHHPHRHADACHLPLSGGG